VNRNARIDALATAENAEEWLQCQNRYLFVESLIGETDIYSDEPNGHIPERAVNYLESKLEERCRTLTPC
jgi:hypothetical protein